MKTAREVLEGMRTALNEQGWVKETLARPSGERCLTGAAIAEVFGMIEQLSNPGEDDEDPQIWLNENIGERFPQEQALYREVIFLLFAAIKDQFPHDFLSAFTKARFRAGVVPLGAASEDFLRSHSMNVEGQWGRLREVCEDPNCVPCHYTRQTVVFGFNDAELTVFPDIDKAVEQAIKFAVDQP